MNLMKGEKEEGLSAVLPEGFRAVTIKTDMVTGVGGHIKDGDYVDVLVFVNPPYSTEKVKTVFQNVKVLDADYKEKQSSENRFITLCMNPNDAEKLFLVEEISKIKLSLRNRIDKKAKSLTGSSLELVK
jgi:pilus assembly protein CpaB